MRKKIKKYALLFLIIAAFCVAVFISFRSDNSPSSFRSDLFTTKITTNGNGLSGKLSTKNSGISFTLAGSSINKTSKDDIDTYKISSSTSIQYELLGSDNSEYGLKETIILKDKSAPTEFIFNLDLANIKDFKPNPEDGSWHFYDNDGKEIFYIPAGEMIDGKGTHSKKVKIAILNENSQLTAKVSVDKDWVSDPKRTFPIKVDPSIVVLGELAGTNSAVVSGGINSADAQFGSLQRKIVYSTSSSAWYAFYSDAGTVYYKKSTDGSTWGSAVSIDSSDTDDYNPTVWLEGGLIYTSWLDDGADAVEVNTINTASADALGTKCTSSDLGTLDNTFFPSVAVADNGTVYLSYSDTSVGLDFGTLKLTFSGCTFSSIGGSVSAIAQGVTVAWPSTAGSIPSGWTRVTALDEKYLKGVATAGTNPGTTGGTTTHSHTTSAHTHTVNHGHTGNGATGGALTVDENGTGGFNNLTTGTHTTPDISSSTIDSGSATPSTDSQNNDPSHLDVIWIESDGTPTGIPDGALALWNSQTLPTDWIQNPDAQDAFLKGAAAAGDGGATGGVDTHNHTGSGSHNHTSSHTHTSANTTSSGHDASGCCTSGSGNANNLGSHSHTIAVVADNFGTSNDQTLTTSTDDSEPPYTKVAIIENDSGGQNIPTGAIAIWTGDAVDIPPNWVIADGNNSTPNLLGKYIKGADALSEIGDTGGATTHSHTGSNHTHTWTSTSHTHSRTYGNVTGSNSRSNTGTGFNGITNVHNHTASNTASATVSTIGDAAPNEDSVVSEPPYYETAYMVYEGTPGGKSQVLTTIGNSLYMVYQDGNLSQSIYDGSEWTTNNQTIASVSDNFFSLTTDNTNLYLLSVSGTTSTNFYKYNGSSWTSLDSPWTSETDIEGVSLTYDSSNVALYAYSIKDTVDQAYIKTTGTSSINWTNESSLAFTSGSLNEISALMTGSAKRGVVLNQGSNLEANTSANSVIVTDADAQFGSLQRKIVYSTSSSAWYAFYSDAGTVYYKKSTDGSTWGSAVDIDSGDTDNYNPTTWLEGGLIYTSWFDDSGDAVEVNTINTASADALGTKCTSSDLGTLDNTYFPSVAVADNGTVYVAYSDTIVGTTYGTLKLVFSGCTFTNVGVDTIPQGVTVAWPSTNASIPSGWTRVTALDTYYTKEVATAGTNPGTTGGTSTHTHSIASHNHSINHGHDVSDTSSSPSDTTSIQTGSASTASSGTHTHTATVPTSSTLNSASTTATSDSQNNTPANLSVIWIQSDGTPTGIPPGAIGYFNSASLPSGWSQTTSVKDAFLIGAAGGGNGGSTGGSATHSHAGGSHGASHTTTHSHVDFTSSAASSSNVSSGVGIGAAAASHTHADVASVSTSPSALTAATISTSSDSEDPPYYKQAIIQNDNAGASFPANIIALWTGTVASIPSGWVIADGNNSTPNLLGRYVKGADALGEIGNTGGSTSHSHTGVNHTHAWTSTHTHTLSIPDISDSSALRSSAGSGVTAASDDHGHTSMTSGAVASATVGNNNPAAASSTSEPVNYQVAYIMSPTGGVTIGGKSQVAVTIGNDLHIVYQDGNLSHSIYNGSSWSTSDQTIASVTDGTYSLTTDNTNLYLLTVSGTTSTNMYKYNGAWSVQASPWTNQVNLFQVSLTYSSSNAALYAATIKDANEQAYWIGTYVSNISWLHEHPFDFIPGSLGDLSMPLSVTDPNQIGALLRQDVNLEFSNTNGPPFEKSEIRGGVQFRGGVTFD